MLGKNMIYELRQYTVAAGRMEECQTLFQDVIDPLFNEVGTVSYTHLTLPTKA